ncbi:DUF2568 domain-containing protein [Nocardia colli]|uniref:DUF2568 domain-containing protein n=2 Tax=Nocardia colli TaxID=2545717 RepID=A0A5N0DN51_9NOCA|nr:DUF2568 domain-containing protein [Nocardia colli]
MLAIRFLLELVAIASFGIYGWRAFDSPWKFLLVILLPLVAAAAWGTFAVPDDPSRSGEAPVAIPGLVRLLVELAVLGGGAAALWAADLPRWALISAIVLAIYQALAYDRLLWLAKA